MLVKVLKNHLGKVSVRDYKVNTCVLKKQDLIIEHDDQQMTIPNEDIYTRIVSQSDWFKSKIGGRSYRLIDFSWIPDEK